MVSEKQTVSEQKKIDIEKFIERTKQLKANIDVAERALLDFLHENSNIIEGTDFLTFSHFLRHYDIIDVARYDKYVRAKEMLEPEEIESIGINGVVAVGGLKKVEEQRELIAEIKVNEKTNERPISNHSAQRLAKGQAGRQLAKKTRATGFNTVATQLVASKSEVVQLQETNAALRAEIKQLKDENKRLKNENAKLTKALKKSPVAA